jgi:WD40 repeat protein
VVFEGFNVSNEFCRHGRDEAIRVWKLPVEVEKDMDKTLPAEVGERKGKDPWLLHSLKSSTISFCTISTCKVLEDADSILVAGPAEALGAVDVIQLPSETKVHAIPSIAGTNPSMLMSLQLLNLPKTGLTLFTASESGAVAIRAMSAEMKWTTIYESKCHTQPVLSLAAVPSLDSFFSSAADARIVKHTLPDNVGGKKDDEDKVVIKTGHSGQQGLVIRCDGRIFATAGWDSRVRIYSSKTCAEVAVLKWHKEACYSLAFADILEEKKEEQSLTVLPSASVQAHSSIPSVKERRLNKMKNTHWLAAGSKDGKVSLWDIF